jgi:hypothetical protein
MAHPAAGATFVARENASPRASPMSIALATSSIHARWAKPHAPQRRRKRHVSRRETGQTACPVSTPSLTQEKGPMASAMTVRASLVEPCPKIAANRASPARPAAHAIEPTTSPSVTASAPVTDPGDCLRARTLSLSARCGWSPGVALAARGRNHHRRSPFRDVTAATSGMKSARSTGQSR